VVFLAWPGISAEFVFHAAEGVSVAARQGKVAHEDGRVTVSGLTPGTDVAIEVSGKNGFVSQIVLLSREQARNLWKAHIAGQERLILSPADLYFDGDRIHLSSSDPAQLTFGVFPPAETKPSGFTPAGQDGIFERYAAAVHPVNVEPVIHQIAPAGQAPPVRMGKEVAMAPTEADFQAAARWSIRVTNPKAEGVEELFLRIEYQGDVARLYAGDQLITDDFYHGAPWEIGLRNVPYPQNGFELKILPLRQDAPVYLQEGARPAIPKGGQVARLVKVSAIPRYRAVADLAQKHVN
jgi:hypothetical protein